jgi:hypothetical protein
MAVSYKEKFRSGVSNILCRKRTLGIVLAGLPLIPGVTLASFAGAVLLTSDQEPAQVSPVTSTLQEFPQLYEAEDASLDRDFTVLTNHADFSGSGFVDYVGEGAVEWVVDTDEGGKFLLSFRYALRSGDRPLDIVVNGAVVSPNTSFPATGSWDAWQLVETEVTLNPGVNTIRAQTRGSSGPNMDGMLASFAGAVLLTSDQEAAQVSPVTSSLQEYPQQYEAEDASLDPDFAVLTNHADFSGSGFVDYVGEGAVEWVVDTDEGGKFLLSFRYALRSGDRPLDIVVNGAVVSPNTSFPGTGSWEAWRSVETEVILNPGVNTIRAQTRGSSGPNMDSMEADFVTASTVLSMNN